MKRRDFLKGLAVAPAIAFLGLPKAEAAYFKPVADYLHFDVKAGRFEGVNAGRVITGQFVEWKNRNAGRVLNDGWVRRIERTGV